MAGKYTAYERELFKTQVGRVLYKRWIEAVAEGDPAWPSYAAFYKWAIAQGYRKGCRLLRRDPSKPMSPTNCYVYETAGDAYQRADDQEAIERWNATVNQLRAAFGLPPLRNMED